jgi:putative Mn2+ efflux pump MntP
VYHGLIYVLSWPIEYILNSIINSDVKTALQNTLDTAVASVPGFIVLPNSTIGVDYQITTKPKITSNYLTVYINGTFYDGASTFTVPPVPQPRDFPEFDTESGHHVQTFVSEYVLNTALYQVFDKGMMKINVTNDMMPPEAGIQFGTEWLKKFIPNINNYFNTSTNVTMGLNVVSNPLVTISQRTMKVNAETQLAFYYFDKDNVTTIVQLQANLEVNANVSLANWTIKPYIVNATFGKFTVLKSNVGNVTGDIFQQGFNILFLFAIGGFNDQFKPIDLPKVPGVSLETSTVTFEEGHVRIQASPAYSQAPALASPAQRSLRTEKI